MKKKYEKPIIEVIKFEVEEIIACSGDYDKGNKGHHYGWDKKEHK